MSRWIIMHRRLRAGSVVCGGSDYIPSSSYSYGGGPCPWLGERVWVVSNGTAVPAAVCSSVVASVAKGEHALGSW
jgi:hypothetical protein